LGGARQISEIENSHHSGNSHRLSVNRKYAIKINSARDLLQIAFSLSLPWTDVDFIIAIHHSSDDKIQQYKKPTFRPYFGHYQVNGKIETMNI